MIQITSSDGAIGGHGLDYWWEQRVTAMGLVPLGIWFIVSVLRLPTHSYLMLAAWMRESRNAVLLIVLILLIASHSNLGVRVIVEDYVHHPGTRALTLAVIRFAHIVLAAAAIFGVLKVAFGAAA